jgi:hypothetical protein
MKAFKSTEVYEDIIDYLRSQAISESAIEYVMEFVCDYAEARIEEARVGL